MVVCWGNANRTKQNAKNIPNKRSNKEGSPSKGSERAQSPGTEASPAFDEGTDVVHWGEVICCWNSVVVIIVFFLFEKSKTGLTIFGGCFLRKLNTLTIRMETRKRTERDTLIQRLRLP